MFRFKRYLSEQELGPMGPEEIAARLAAIRAGGPIPDMSYVERSRFPQQTTGRRLSFVPGEGNRPGRIRTVGGPHPDSDYGWSLDPDSPNAGNIGRQIAAGVIDPADHRAQLRLTPPLTALGREQRTPETFRRPQPITGLGPIGPRAVNREAARGRLARIQQTRGAGILSTIATGVGREMMRQDARAGRRGASATAIRNLSAATDALSQGGVARGIGAVADRLGRITQRITNLGRPMGIGVNNPQTDQDEAQRQQVLQGAAQNQLVALRQNPNYQAFQSGQQLAKDAADRAQYVANRRQQIKQGEESLESPEQTRFRMANNATFSATTSPTTRRYGMQDLGLDQTDFYPNISPQDREQIAAAARQRMAARNATTASTA